MNRCDEMIRLMAELYGEPDTWPVPERKSQAGQISKARAKVYQQVKRGIRSGALTPGPCRMCGSIRHVHAHHVDYAKPFEVEWLCASCHIRQHRAADRAAFLAKLAQER